MYVGFISGTILGRMWNRSTPLSEIMIEIWQSTWDKVKGSKGKVYKKCENEKCKELFSFLFKGKSIKKKFGNDTLESVNVERARWGRHTSRKV